MTEHLSFDSHPDPELGARLREALDGPDPELFLARVRDGVSAAGRETPWDVLTRWAPAGVAAAMVAAILCWFALRPIASPDEGNQLIASAPARMDIAPGQPEADVLVTSVLEGR
jgi:hypothetical protein